MSLPITLRARHILPISGEAIEDGWLRIERGRIVAIGRRKPPGPVQDVGPAIILPGLINAHTHLEFSDLSAPLSGAGGLPAWIERIVALRRLRPDGQTEALRLESAIDAGLYESALAGVTGIGEIATALGPCAYRGKGGPRLRVYREAIGLSPAAIVRASSSLVRDCKHLSQGSVAAGISPHAPYSVAATLGTQLISTSRTLGLPIAMHLAESREEAELLATGGGPLRSMLENLGAWPTLTPPTLLSAADWITLVAKAPRGLIVHGTFLGDDRRGAALARLSRHRDRLCVVVCPRTTALLSGVLPPLSLFQSEGVRVAIGTDSRASNPDLSVLAECRRIVDAGLVSPIEALTMATRNGAWALMQEHRSGILALSRPADLVILMPTGHHPDPYQAALDPTTSVMATLRNGKTITP